MKQHASQTGRKSIGIGALDGRTLCCVPNRSRLAMAGTGLNRRKLLSPLIYTLNQQGSWV